MTRSNISVRHKYNYHLSLLSCYGCDHPIRWVNTSGDSPAGSSHQAKSGTFTAFPASYRRELLKEAYGRIPRTTHLYRRPHADTQHLSDEELGAYLKLLMLTWRTANCKLPADAAWHMRRLGADESKYNRLFKPLLAEFFITDGNSVYQKRLLKEFHYLRDLSVKQSARAKARWDKEKRSCRDSAASGNAPHPTPPTKDSGAKAPSSPHTPYPDWLPVDTFGAFKEMRKGQRSRLTPKAEQLAITQLDKLRAEGHDPTLVIEQSILRGWKSFYKLKGDHDEDTRHRPASPESKWVTEGRRLAEKYRSQALADGQSDAR